MLVMGHARSAAVSFTGSDWKHYSETFLSLFCHSSVRYCKLAICGRMEVMKYMVCGLCVLQAAGFKESGGAATVVIGVVQVIATVVACTMMDKLGRRKLLIIAGLGMALSCFTLGLYYNVSRANAASTGSLSWLALASLIGYIVAFSLGWGPVPMLFMSEVLPARARGTASGAATLVNWGLAFFVTKFFSSMQEAAGLDGSFWLFGIACLFAVLFVFRQVPETNGRSLEEIEQFFAGQSIARSTVTYA